MESDSFNEIAAASENSMPISSKRQIELIKISNDIWNYMINQHGCSGIEAQFVTAMITTFANNHQS